MNVEKVCELVAKALEIDTDLIRSDSSAETVEIWDSLGQISILAQLDEQFQNVTEQCPELASAVSVAEIQKILTDAGY